MKKMMMALAALCVAGVAGAVTVKWDTEGTKLNSSGKVTSATALDVATTNPTGAWTIACVMNITVTNASFAGGHKYPVLFGLGNGSMTGNDDDITAGLNADANNSLQMGIRGDGTVASPEVKQNLGTGTYEFTVSFDGDNTLTFYIDGNKYGTISSWDVPDDLYVAVGAQGFGENTSGQRLDRGATYSADVYFVNGKTYEQLSVPEPTALALLALGVAGLALRRKAA